MLEHQHVSSALGDISGGRVHEVTSSGYKVSHIDRGLARAWNDAHGINPAFLDLTHVGLAGVRAALGTVAGANPDRVRDFAETPILANTLLFPNPDLRDQLEHYDNTTAKNIVGAYTMGAELLSLAKAATVLVESGTTSSSTVDAAPHITHTYDVPIFTSQSQQPRRWEAVGEAYSSNHPIKRLHARYTATGDALWFAADQVQEGPVVRDIIVVEFPSTRSNGLAVEVSAFTSAEGFPRHHNVDQFAQVPRFTNTMIVALS